MNSKLVVFEGPTGSGKTTFANAVANAEQWAKELGNDLENPFLERYYGLGEECGNDMENAFVEQRLRQTNNSLIPLLSVSETVVADFHLIRNFVYASFVLSPNDYVDYCRSYRVHLDEYVRPKLFVLLIGSGTTLRKRIAMRSTRFEQSLTVDYLSALSARFELEVRDYCHRSEVALHTINIDETDIVAHPNHLRQQRRLIKELLG